MKKTLKKTKKKAVKKSVARRGKKALPKKAAKAKKSPKAQKPVGKVIHFYNHIKVAIVKFKVKVPAKAKLHYKGATTDFVDTATSMQFDHKTIAIAPKGKQIGIKVKKRVRDGDLVFKAE